ncbi:GNAT family N-acetyltransferase [Streptomyces ginkgonis]|uniref:GNAT family N-acetyltransferase n=1 Tax=Streptomyces ginkgonis TaxID=1812259 RepID=UPI002176C065|nr:GNAT family N-acetyltransferase [Streptomyces ginkgonis]
MTSAAITETVPAGTVRSWVDGWVVSRGAADPVPRPWGWSIDVGTPAEAGRHVVADGDETAVRALARDFAVPGRWLKVFLPGVTSAHDAPYAAQEVVAPWLVEGWSFDLPGFLMTTALRHSPAPVPDDYRLRVWTRGGVIRAAVLTPRGALAARGQIAPTGPTAVADQIETFPGHRRRGLGSVVMRTLHNTALDHGARTGVLVATVEGRALYEHLGWRTHIPMASIRFRGEAG